MLYILEMLSCREEKRREEKRQVLLTPSFSIDGRLECEGISQARQPYDSYALWAITGTCRDFGR